jgi:hypothetical protein
MASKKKRTSNVGPSREVLKLINLYADTVKLGFSEENWTMAARILNDLSYMIPLDMKSELGDLMAQSYVDCNFSYVDDRVSNVVDRLSSYS